MLNKSDVNKNKLGTGGISLVICAVIFFMNAASLQAQSSSRDNKYEAPCIQGNSEIIMRDDKFTIVEHSTPLNQILRELSPAEEEGLRRYDDLVKIEEISRMKDKEKAAEQLLALFASHSDPVVRLNALTSLNDISSIDEQTLIQTVSNESDPRVKIQAIEYLTDKLDENPDIEKYLSIKLEVN